MPQPAVPQKADYWTNMIEWAGYLKAWFIANNHPANDNGLGQAFYDGEACAYKVRDYTSDDATHGQFIQEAFDAYVPYYVIPNNGSIQGFRNFTEGQLEDVLRNTSRKTQALNSINLQLLNASYTATGNVADDLFSRECAYGLMTHINASRAGITLDSTQIARRDQLFEWSLGHVSQWTEGAADYFRPFMGALTAKALIWYFLYVSQDSRVVPAVKALCDYAWNYCWKDAAGSWGFGKSFLYTDRITGVEPQDGNTQPDLNMLIAPMFGFVWWRTGDQTYRTRGDEIFKGSITVYSGSVYVSGAYLGTRSSSNPAGKQYNQQLYWGPKYIEWAESDPIVGPITPPPVTPPPSGGIGTPGLFPIPATVKGQQNFQGLYQGKIIPCPVTISQANTKYLIYQPAADAHAGIVGWLYSEKDAHVLTIYSSDVNANPVIDNVVTKLEMAAESGIGKDISKNPLLISNKGQALKISSDVAVVPMIIYVIEMKSFNFD